MMRALPTWAILLMAPSAALSQDIQWTATSSPGSQPAYGYGVAIDGTGVYMVGRDSASGYEWRIEKRDRFTGALIWGISSNPSSGSDAATGVAVDASGVYIVGYDNDGGDDRWRMEKRERIGRAHV